MSEIDDPALDGLAPEVDMAASRALFERRRARRRTKQRAGYVGGALGLVAIVAIVVVALGSSSDNDEQIRTVDDPPTTPATAAPIDTVRTIEDVGNGLSVTLQPGWALAPGPLTLTNFQRQGVSQADPAEVLSFGTAPLYYGIDRTCEVANLPVETLDAMESDEVLVQVLERRLRSTPDLPPRPDHFDETTVPEWTNSCADPPATMRRLWFRTDGGGDPEMEREIGVLVVTGDAAPQATVAELWATLDGMDIEPMPNTRQVLELTVPEDLPSFVRTERSDAALDAIPFDAYPWFQIDSWRPYGAGSYGPSLMLVVARADGDWLSRSIAPDLPLELTVAPEGVTHDADEFPLLAIHRDRSDGPMRWRWWTPEEGYIAFLMGTNVTEEELASLTASAQWVERRIEPDGISWRAPYPVGCFPLTPQPASPPPPANDVDPAFNLPLATSTVLEQALWSFSTSGLSLGMMYDEAYATELVARDGEVWLRRDANGNVNLDNGTVETTEERGVQLQAVTAQHGIDAGSPANVEGLPVTAASCQPAP